MTSFKAQLLDKLVLARSHSCLTIQEIGEILWLRGFVLELTQKDLDRKMGGTDVKDRRRIPEKNSTKTKKGVLQERGVITKPN